MATVNDDNPYRSPLAAGAEVQVRPGRWLHGKATWFASALGIAYLLVPLGMRMVVDFDSIAMLATALICFGPASFCFAAAQCFYVGNDQTGRWLIRIVAYPTTVVLGAAAISAAML